MKPYLVLVATCLIIGCNHLQQPAIPFSIAIDQTMTRADGTSTLSVTIEYFNNNADSVNRVIRLETDGGTFSQYGAEDPDTIIFIPQGSSAVDIPLTVGTDHGDFFVKASLVANPNSFDQDAFSLGELRGGDFINISVDDDELLADGIASTTVYIELTETLFENVTLSVSNGTLSVTSLDLFEKKGAFIFTSGDNTGLSVINVNVGDMFNHKDTIELTPSYPEQLFLNPDKYTIDSLDNTGVIISFYLLKSTGKVSNGTKVQFGAEQAGNPIGTFSNSFALTDSDGKGSITFKTNIPGVDKSKTITITAEIDRGAMGILSESFELYINQ